MRKVLDREEPGHPRRRRDLAAVPGPGALGQGKPLKSIMHPVADDPDLAGLRRPEEHRAVRGDRRRLAADGARAGRLVASRRSNGLREARRTTCRLRSLHRMLTCRHHRRREGRRSTRMRPLTAMYVGGMGSATHNYHRDAMARRGFPEAAARSRSCGSPGARRRQSPPCPTSTSSSRRCSAPRSASDDAGRRGLRPAGTTGSSSVPRNRKRSS